MATAAKAPKPADLKAIFGLEPEKAVAYLKSKGYAITWNWQEMRDQAHDQAFTVAKAMRLDLLSDIRAALETALQDGQTLKQFIRCTVTMTRCGQQSIPPNGFNCRCRVTALSESAVKRRGLTIVSSQGQVSSETVETGTDKRTGEIRTAQVTLVRTTDAAGKPITFRTDPGSNHAPGTGLADMLKRKQDAA